MTRSFRFGFAASFLTLAPLAGEEVNVLALGEGTSVVVEPASYSSWPPIHLIDDAVTSGWAGESGKTGGQVFVFEMPSIGSFVRKAA